jgi:hypothetical protein
MAAWTSSTRSRVLGPRPVRLASGAAPAARQLERQAPAVDLRRGAPRALPSPAARAAHPAHDHGPACAAPRTRAHGDGDTVDELEEGSPACRSASSAGPVRSWARSSSRRRGAAKPLNSTDEAGCRTSWRRCSLHYERRAALLPRPLNGAPYPLYGEKEGKRNDSSRSRVQSSVRLATPPCADSTAVCRRRSDRPLRSPRRYRGDRVDHRLGAHGLHRRQRHRVDLSRADSGLLLAVFSAEPGSRSAEALDLLASWTATPEHVHTRGEARGT